VRPQLILGHIYSLHLLPAPSRPTALLTRTRAGESEDDWVRETLEWSQKYVVYPTQL
jgi:hypothetical protein